MTVKAYDGVVVGAGPNGLAAAITLARAGQSVILFEQAEEIGGGLRSAALTLPGFVHDVCSSVYPLGVASPFFRSLPLESLGVQWADPPVPLAHPLEGGRVVVMGRSVNQTAALLGDDRHAYKQLFAPLADDWSPLVDEVLAPIHVPRHPWLLARFAIDALRSAESVSSRFGGEAARALMAGLAAHSVLKLDAAPSAGVALLLGALAHGVGWPFVRGGAGRLAEALATEFRRLGGVIVTGQRVSSLDELPPAQALICDVTPRQLVAMGGARLPPGFRAALTRYQYGPGVFKVDWALSDQIPWRAAECRGAGTVHVGGSWDDIASAEAAACDGVVSDRPFVLLTQPTVADPGRAPSDRHVAWGYCHVPHGSPVDMTSRIESQIERFAPGFRDTILARSVAGPADLERRNPNLIGGDVAGGAMSLGQLFARPTWRGYRTPVAGLYLCSSSTLPGGGVHGMCGYHAARAALGRR